MSRSEEDVKSGAREPATGTERPAPARHPWYSKRVTDHLANERTFLAWVRTGIAVIAFGFVVERFGLLLRQLGFKSDAPLFPGHYSTIVGITLTILGTIVLIIALFNFLQVRRSIDAEEFYPRAGYAVALTIITSLIGVLLAVYLYFAA
jgi:putative membrane protein